MSQETLKQKKKRKRRKKKPSSADDSQYARSVTPGHPRPGTQTSNARAGGTSIRKPSLKMKRRKAQRKYKVKKSVTLWPSQSKSTFRVHVGTDVTVEAPEEFIDAFIRVTVPETVPAEDEDYSDVLAYPEMEDVG